MKVLRILAALVFLIGAVYFLTALLMLVVLSMDPTSQMETAGAGSNSRNEIAAVSLAVIGLLSVVGATGLFAAKEWARKWWPLLAALAVLVHVVWFISDLLRGSVAVRDWLTLVIVILVYVASAVYARRADTRAFFRSAKP